MYAWSFCDSTIFLFLRVLLIKKEKKEKMKMSLNHLCKNMNKRLDTLVSVLFPSFCSSNFYRICVGSVLIVQNEC